MFDQPRTRVLDAWLAHSRRQKSRNPESRRAGKREEVENVYESTEKTEVPLRGFPAPSRGDPNHRIRGPLMYFIISVRSAIGSPASPKMLPSHTPKYHLVKSDLCTGINQHAATVRAFIFIARRLQPFLPSLTDIQLLCTYTIPAPTR